MLIRRLRATPCRSGAVISTVIIGSGPDIRCQVAEVRLDQDVLIVAERPTPAEAITAHEAYVAKNGGAGPPSHG